jgi:hypothetical protein
MFSSQANILILFVIPAFGQFLTWRLSKNRYGIWLISARFRKDLSRNPHPEARFNVQTRLVHRFIDSAGQIHLEETGIALIPGVDVYEIVK